MIPFDYTLGAAKTVVSKNDLPHDAPERHQFVTLHSAPNTYITYPALGEVVVHEFDIHGKPNVVGFRAYQTDGTFGPVVRLGVAWQCRWTEGFSVGATVAVSFRDGQDILGL